MSDEEAEPYIRAAIRARQKAIKAMEESDQAIADAMQKGASPTTLAKRLGVHRTRVYQIRDAAKK